MYIVLAIPKICSFVMLFDLFLTFLSNRHGDSNKTNIYVANQRVGCIPELRYFKHAGVQSLEKVAEEQLIFLVEVRYSLVMVRVALVE